jgi:hypothetical protein
MAQDLHVDLKDLQQFITALEFFQTQMSEKFKALELDWKLCDDSWEGDAKTQFEKEFSPTISKLSSSLQGGNEAIEWLQRYYGLVEEFEKY